MSGTLLSARIIKGLSHKNDVLKLQEECRVGHPMRSGTFSLSLSNSMKPMQDHHALAYSKCQNEGNTSGGMSKHCQQMSPFIVW